METYLAIITSVLVLTQAIRLIQNSIQLHRQRRIYAEQLKNIQDVTEDDLNTKRMVDKELVRLMPQIETFINKVCPEVKANG